MFGAESTLLIQLVPRLVSHGSGRSAEQIHAVARARSRYLYVWHP
jgi:hypothetical protein